MLRHGPPKIVLQQPQPLPDIRHFSQRRKRYSAQLVGQRLRLLRIGGFESLREPTVDMGEEVAGIGGLSDQSRTGMASGSVPYRPKKIDDHSGSLALRRASI